MVLRLAEEETERENVVVFWKKLSLCCLPVPGNGFKFHKA